MEHGDFRFGMIFMCGDRLWRCTDIGTRVIVAIRIDAVEVASSGGGRFLNQAQAEADGWFDGPPYAVAEVVFDEDDFEVCSLKPMAEG